MLMKVSYRPQRYQDAGGRSFNCRALIIRAQQIGRPLESQQASLKSIIEGATINSWKKVLKTVKLGFLYGFLLRFFCESD
jgi:hypothetical protein